MADHSMTPLIKKLGIKPAHSLRFFDAPDHYFDLISPLPPDVEAIEAGDPGQSDFLHAFATDPKALKADFSTWKAQMKIDGMLWVSWAKKSSKLATEVDSNMVRTTGLANGLVDCKVCSVDTDWSAMKFVFRLKDR